MIMILQTTGGKDEPNIVFLRKSLRTSGDGFVEPANNLLPIYSTFNKTKWSKSNCFFI